MRRAIDMLQAELKELEYEFKVALPKEIGAAAAMGDLRENAEYHAARERQSFVRARIGQIQERLGSLKSMTKDQIPKDRAGLGSRLVLLDQGNDAEIRYELVIPEMADLEKGLISIASPIGRSMVGKQEGDEIVAKIPSGKKNFELLELETIHDRDDVDF